ncbi:flagellar basal-body rod protein FlgG [Limnobacter humi]|uniref:Flagellar basal-body rod protein FlgF n=1 Tax=Limnobacter humi TaxID=1778671 RepID=A0ABT1WJ42_9BURK|nr:flagellar basal-body rod protein FlgG [Limnobacter humi]MCQ8897543.1 flagellar basal-body rod protein FlgG [Limnobacter humi]
MLRSLYIAKTGLEAQQTQLDVISNNLANTSTNGFKRSRAVFEDLLYQNLREPGAPTTDQTKAPTGLQVGTGVRTVAAVRNFSQGNLQQTGNPLDVAINGAGFFQVEQPDGTIAYTRDGSFQLNAEGVLVTTAGFPVSGPITVPPETEQITIAADGQVSARLAGQVQLQELGRLNLATFINPAGLNSIGGNLYLQTEASGEPQELEPGVNGAGRLQQLYVETSNVNVVEELVGLISTQRAYEINSKAVTASDQMLQRLGQL